MRLASIGIFENPCDEIAPTHVSPIITCESSDGWQRVTYKITQPYMIEIGKPFGNTSKDGNSLFPVPSYLHHLPIEIEQKTQSIYLGRGKVLYEKRVWRITVTLLTHAIRSMSLRYWKRSIQTIRNAQCVGLPSKLGAQGTVQVLPPNNLTGTSPSEGNVKFP